MAFCSRISIINIHFIITVMFFLPGCASSTVEIDESLSQSALGGNVQAQYEIGEKYYKARYSYFGKAGYWDDALPWYEMAANQGDARAHYRLSQYYFNNHSDYNQSFKWLQLPAQQGIAEAQHLLGMHYAQAWGTPQNPVLAYKWIALSFEGGVPDPIGKLADLEWLITRGKMDPDQIREGQQLAAEHTARYGRSRSIELIH